MLQRLYYFLKPITPWRLRMVFRRIIARRQWRRAEDVWPIDRIASRAPDGWPGWPEGKKFAVVLTHDVEGPVGLGRCRQLAELERGLNFRSCFNFIPEGSYRVPINLREWLTENGFEVGVHDLQHDGNLYASEAAFRRNAARINQYFEEWRACGFRGGFMLRNLDWLHQLNLRYDSSTFDTDPFEWQSDGSRTIFPFIVSSDRAEGLASEVHAATNFRDAPSLTAIPSTNRRVSRYVELPYTLPQDSTIYLTLEQTDASIWCRKLDWIAEHGGMALLNVHPDYLDFRAGGSRFPRVEQHYSAFLRHVAERYGDQYWQPLPRQLAEFIWDWKFQHAEAPTSHDSSTS